MPANWKVEMPERLISAGRAEKGIPEFEIAPHREAKPPVDSVDAETVPVPAREQAKADGTFGVELPYEQREKA